MNERPPRPPNGPSSEPAAASAVRLAARARRPAATSALAGLMFPATAGGWSATDRPRGPDRARERADTAHPAAAEAPGGAEPGAGRDAGPGAGRDAGPGPPAVLPDDAALTPASKTAGPAAAGRAGDAPAAGLPDRARRPPSLASGPTVPPQPAGAAPGQQPVTEAARQQVPPDPGRTPGGGRSSGPAGAAPAAGHGGEPSGLIERSLRGARAIAGLTAEPAVTRPSQASAAGRAERTTAAIPEMGPVQAMPDTDPARLPAAATPDRTPDHETTHAGRAAGAPGEAALAHARAHQRPEAARAPRVTIGEIHVHVAAPPAAPPDPLAALARYASGLAARRAVRP